MKEVISCPFFVGLEKYPENIAWTSQEASLSYKEANLLISQNQIYLKSLNFKQNHTIALRSEQSIRFLALLFAAHRENIRVVILGDFSTPEGFEQAILRSKATLLNLDNVKLEDLDNLSEINTTLDLSLEAVVLFTSGSTGIEKGVVLSLNNLFKSAKASNSCTGLVEASTWLSSLTLARIGGLAISYRTAIAGAALEFAGSLSISFLSSMVKLGKVTHLSLVPTQLQELLKDTENINYLKSLTCILLGGAPAAESLLRDIINLNIPVLTTYGMTETCSHISLASLNDPITRVQSSGKILKHTKVRFENENGEFSDAPNFVGKLQVKGETVALSYVDEVGADKFLPEGWYDTGDIAFLDDQYQLNIIGRSDSMIISGGENIHLREIEIMAERLNGVNAAAAIGVPHEKWGTRPVLFIETSTLNSDEILEYLKLKLTKIKVPDRVIVLQGFPRISIGKIDYQNLKKLLA